MFYSSINEMYKVLYENFGFDISILDSGDFHPLQALLLVALSNVENGPWRFDIISSRTMDTLEAITVAQEFEKTYLEVKSDYKDNPSDVGVQDGYRQYAKANEILKIEISILAKSAGIDCEKYMIGKYTCVQLLEIVLAAYQDLDVSQLDNSEYSSQRMHLISDALKFGFDISYFKNMDFNDSQLLEIYWGLESGIDVSNYAKPDIDAKRMFAERLKLRNK